MAAAVVSLAGEPDERCAAAAAQQHRLNHQVLVAVLRAEAASRLPVVTSEADGRIDIGAGRVGRFTLGELARAGVAPAHAETRCAATFAVAWHLARNVQEHGNGWEAIGRFASDATYYRHRFQALVQNELVRMGLLAGPAWSVPSLRPSESPDAPGADELVIYQVLIQD